MVKVVGDFQYGFILFRVLKISLVSRLSAINIYLYTCTSMQYVRACFKNRRAHTYVMYVRVGWKRPGLLLAINVWIRIHDSRRRRRRRKKTKRNEIRPYNHWQQQYIIMLYTNIRVLPRRTRYAYVYFLPYGGIIVIFVFTRDKPIDSDAKQKRIDPFIMRRAPVYNVQTQLVTPISIIITRVYDFSIIIITDIFYGSHTARLYIIYFMNEVHRK